MKKTNPGQGSQSTVHAEAQSFSELWRSLSPEQQKEVLEAKQHPFRHPFAWLFGQDEGGGTALPNYSNST